MRIKTGQDRRSTGRAERGGAEVVREPQAFAAETIQVRRRDDRLRFQADRVPALIVRQDEQDVRTILSGDTAREAGERQENEGRRR